MVYNMDVSGNIGLALILTAIAGLSTGIGSAIAYFIKKPKMIYLSFSLGFSAGGMIYISFMELLPKGLEVDVLSQSLHCIPGRLHLVHASLFHQSQDTFQQVLLRRKKWR